jgi:hypothetical protein
MSSKRTVVTPGAGSAYAAQNAPDVNPPFEANLLVLSLEAGAEAQVSFNGLTDDVQLIAGVVASVTIPARIQQVWCKSTGGATVGVWQTNMATAH